MFKEFVHVVSEPRIVSKILDWGLIWGNLIGVLFLAVALVILKDRKAVVFSLLLVSGSALLIWPAESLRNRQRIFDVDHAVAVSKLNSVRQKHSWVFYAQAALSSLSVLALSSKGKAVKFMIAAVLIGGLAVAGFGLWLQVTELQIYSPVLRTHP